MEFGRPLPLDQPEEEVIEQIYQLARMVETNDAFARMYGYGSAEEMGLWRLKDFLARDSTTISMIRKAHRSNYQVLDLETAEQDRHGNTKFFLNNVTGEIEGGELVRIWGTQRDVTQRKIRAQELDQAKKELALAGRRATVGELTGAIAHELNQPLTAIANNTLVAQRLLRAEEPDLVEVALILDDIAADQLRAAGVIGGIRALLSHREVTRVAFDVETLVREVTELLRTDTILRRVSVCFDFEPALPAAWGSTVQIQQVLLNLVLNACEASQDGAEASRQLTVGAAREGEEQVRVFVTDHGTGFGDLEPDELFEPFRTTKPDGMGLGLAISRRLVDAHGGRLWAKENPEGGASFQFTLPCSEE
jgi:PAS domain S-box-containing protein